uniref:HAT C-terminal dimerisation domain-containing protein n=1 Tax=Amphimedon queenslandica TaxID=400682 RepID=A0A1X7U3U8_AMPQE
MNLMCVIISIVLRYVNSETLIIHKDLVGFFECDTGITGRALADKITATLNDFHLNLSFLRGQGYDGAGNMAGSVKGTAALITEEYPLALYLHCASHCLNLAVVKSLQSTNRQRAYELAIAETQPSSSVQKLKDLCRTCWVDSLSTFCSLYKSTVSCMETIISEGPQLWSSDSLTDARIPAYNLHSPTVNLHGECLDIVTAVQEIDTVIPTVKNVRDNIDRYHSEWFHNVQKMCEVTSTIPSIPRTCRHQTQRCNVPADTPSQYFCRTITIPLVDHLVSQLTARFTQHHKLALLGWLSLVPSAMTKMSKEAFTENILKLSDLYSIDLPSPGSMNSEVECWKLKWEQHLSIHGPSSLPNSLTSTLAQTSSMYPNIKTLLIILGILPVTSCSAVRYFRSLKRMKTPYCSTMTTHRLASLSLLHLHRDSEIDIEAAVDEFSRRHPQRLQVANILRDE